MNIKQLTEATLLTVNQVLEDLDKTEPIDCSEYVNIVEDK